MGTAPQPAGTPLPGLVFETLLAYERTAALRAAIELDLFRAIGEGLDDVDSLAQRCSASPRGIRILCDYLTIIELLTKKDGRYGHTPTSAAFLDPRSPSCIASISRFLGNSTMVSSFQNLAEVIRNGRTLLPGEGSVEPENPVWVEFAHSMAPMMAPVAAPLGGIVLEGLSGPVRVLDIAAGHGLFGIEVARQHPEARIVAVDWAPVLEVAKANARKAGVEARFDALPGSAFDVDYGGPYDIALLTNFLHHFDTPTCIGLLQKVHRAMKPGGRVAVLEFVPNEDRVSPPMAAAFSLVMLATTPSGDAYTFRQLEAMLHEAGFEGVAAHPVPKSPHTVVTGTAK
ncbi:Methyltransferase type 12 [Candidatus Sulfopaludibacter sp. SbA4]|nr:Methyltransferase type 12 [Candidatus Sulfopaludibacter sp. SbA4]